MAKSFYLTKPGEGWEEGLPVGNGRLGAMITGGIREENISLNEETLWFGPSRNRKNPDSRRYLDKVRDLLLEGKTEDAAFLWKMAFTSAPKYNNPYQPAGELHLCFKNHTGKALNYKRKLNISDAVAEVSYTMGGYSYLRTCFASEDYRMLVFRMTTDHPEGMTISANIARKPFEEHSGKLRNLCHEEPALEGNRAQALKMGAELPVIGNWGQNGAGGVHYLTAMTACARSVDGKKAVSVVGDFLYIENAREIILYVTSLTDYEELWETLKKGNDLDFNTVYDAAWPDLQRRAEEILVNGAEAGYEKILREHKAAYHRYFDRFSLRLDTENENLTETVPMNEIMGKIREGQSRYADAMIAFLVDYARYLMISSSVTCLLPANLQGIWNGSFVPPWQSQYTININTEMNYWFVPKVGLTECEAPFLALLEKMRINGRKTAKELYGCRGFCAHHNTNLWACTDPEGVFDSSPFWNMGAAWMACQVYDQYRYSQNRELLEKEILPVMREAILFLEDYLFEDRNGTLLSGPSVSPENTYCTEDGQYGALCLAPAMDSEIIRQLISDYQEGLMALGKEREASLDRILEKLPGYELSDDGRILEWRGKVQETEPGHRHISHLFGLHPGNTITRETPELFQAAAKTLDYRLAHGGGHTGWSKAWICCFMARLGRGEALWENLFQMLQNCILDNLLDVHPPFQIDGNFGLAEAVLEGIAQSHGSYIEIFPALPKRWRNGCVKGLRLRGGITMNLTWKDGVPIECRMKSAVPVEVKICYRGRMIKEKIMPQYQEVKLEAEYE